MSIDGELQALVDAQILEQGAFVFMEFPLESGRLLQGDYERWRRGEIDALDDVLMGSREKIRTQLEAAATYARPDWGAGCQCRAGARAIKQGRATFRKSRVALSSMEKWIAPMRWRFCAFESILTSLKCSQ